MKISIKLKKIKEWSKKEGIIKLSKIITYGLIYARIVLKYSNKIRETSNWTN
jgi:hypothetical protein